MYLPTKDEKPPPLPPRYRRYGHDKEKNASIKLNTAVKDLPNVAQEPSTYENNQRKLNEIEKLELRKGMIIKVLQEEKKKQNLRREIDQLENELAAILKGSRIKLKHQIKANVLCVIYD